MSSTSPCGGSWRLVAMVLPGLAVAFVSGCFNSPDMTKLSCTTSDHCPSGEVCVHAHGTVPGVCGKPIDGGAVDASPAVDGAPAIDSSGAPIDGANDHSTIEASPGRDDASAIDSGVAPIDSANDHSTIDTSPTSDGIPATNNSDSPLVGANDGSGIDQAVTGSNDGPIGSPDVIVTADSPIQTPEVGGACTTSTDCPGLCQSCSSGHICVAVVGQDDPSGHCAGTCDSTGACKSKKGQSCQTVGGGCAGGTFCAPEGICCDTACSGLCESCPTGVCAPVPNGQDPDNECPAQATSTCQNVGGCNGARACRLHPVGTVCAAQVCTQNVQYNQRTCDGLGGCSPATAQNCQTYVCGPTACKLSCSSDADCTTGNYRDGSACVGKKSTGTCASGAQCVSGNCEDSYCGPASSCGECSNRNSSGTCSPVASGADLTGTTCSGTKECASGVCKKKNGQPCPSGTEGNCSSGLCGNGVCCFADCGPCGTCNSSGTGCNWMLTGEFCGTNLVCTSSHSCVSCDYGAACVPSTNECQVGTIDCITGGPTCHQPHDAPEGTACNAGAGYCGSGVCTAKGGTGASCLADFWCISGQCVSDTCL